MKNIFLLYSTVIVLGLLSSCSSKKINVDLNLVSADTTLNVAVGNEIIVLMHENLSTGYMWNLVGTNASVELVKEDYEKVNYPEGWVGGGANKMYIFKALSPGDCKLSFSYSRGWEPNSGHTKNVILTVK